MKKEKGIFEETAEEFSILIDTTDEINDLLIIWKEWSEGSKLIEKQIDRVKDKIRAYLKERHWERHFDKKSNISVTLTTTKREKINKEELTHFLTEAQLAQVTHITTSERLNIITPETRKRLKKYVRTKK